MTSSGHNTSSIFDIDSAAGGNIKTDAGIDASLNYLSNTVDDEMEFFD